MARRHENFKVHIPLYNFQFDGESTEIAPGLKLGRFEATEILPRFESRLSAYEKSHLPNEVGWWLLFESDDHATLSPAEVGNIFLLSLWLVRTTKAKIRFRFEIALNEKSDNFWRVLDRFVHAEEPERVRFTQDELRAACAFYTAFAAIGSESRLFAAELLTLIGCWQLRWQAAILNFAVASETLLTYSTERGLTERVAIAYACLLETDSHDRDRAYSEFHACYSARSDIVHGRSTEIAREDRVAWVVRWQAIVRELWRWILFDPEAIAQLNGDDACRKKYFEKRIGAYKPPVRARGLRRH